MPRISEFYGIAIYMYYCDHPPPHFHAIYGNNEAIVDIQTGEALEGALPRNARRMVSEWAIMRRHELSENWRLAEAQLPLNPIDPLD